MEDLSYSLRSLLRTPAFTAVAIITLALGVGANSAIFSVLNAVLLRPLPFPQPERVVNLAWEGSGHLQASSAAKFQYWHDHARSFQGMATWRSSVAQAEIAGEATTVRTLAVSPDFFTVVDSNSTLIAPGGPGLAMISRRLWQTRFAGAADVAGRAMRVDGELVTIAGVLPESFAFPYEDEPVEVMVPLRLTVDPNNIAEDWPAIARLREGVTIEQAQAEVAALMAPFRAAFPNQVSDRDRGMTLATSSEIYVVAGVRRALWILMSAVTFVLLIACANVANLFLARATGRRQEIAVRSALGASRARIVRLVLTESALVAVAAGVLGLVLGTWIAGTLVALTPAEIPRLASAGIDWRVMAFTFVASLGTSLLFGGAAAWPSARARLAEVLKEAARGSSGKSRLRRGLLVTQSALAMVLLVGAGLLVVTLVRLTSSDPGFDVDDLIAVRLTSRGGSSDPPVGLLQQLEASPAIASIAEASSLPLERGVNTRIAIPGAPDGAGTVEWRAVTPGYFRTLGITLLAGRSFESTDATGGPPVAIVNDTFARRYFAGQNPLGQRIDKGVEIVGVVADVRDVSLRSEPRRTMYVPLAQASPRLLTVLKTMPVFVVRPRSAGANVERALSQAVVAADPSLPAPQVFPLESAIARSLARERFGATLLSMLAALALALTALGIYGVLAYTIQQRRREIGIRMALGAGGGQVTRLVMMQGVAPVLAGLVLGTLGAIGLSRFVAGFLWGVTATDPATMWSVAMVLVGVAAGASWLPARAAAKLDPVSALNAG